MTGKAPDRDVHRGTSAALQQAYGRNGDADVEQHLGALAAEADFAALLAQLNDPPPAYRKGPH